jgi:malate/lactate dehydrogenase
VILGRDGVEKIIEVELSSDEQLALTRSAADVKAGVMDWLNLVEQTTPQ